MKPLAFDPVGLPSSKKLSPSPTDVEKFGLNMNSAVNPVSVERLLPVSHDLEKSTAMLKDGCYETAMDSLRELLSKIRRHGLSHGDRECPPLLAVARAKFQLDDNTGANACLLGVTQDVLDESPELYCDFCVARTNLAS